MHQQLVWKTSEKFGALFDRFKNLYDMVEYIQIPIESNKREVDKIPNKRCKFCNRTEPDTTFKNGAHKISKLLGNRFWYAKDECDNCNSLFSKYETNLGDFFCLDRALMQNPQLNRSPKFKSPQHKLVVEKGDFYSKKGVYAKQSEKSRGHFKYNKETGELIITTEITPFIPLYVYKAFIKIALSLLPFERVQEYPELLSFLANPSATNVPICLLMVYSLHSEARFDFQALFFEKKETKLKIPRHYFYFYWLNNIIVIYLPCHKDDDLYGTLTEPAYLPVPPPLFLNINDELLQELPIQFFDQDFGSKELRKGAQREVSVKVDIETMKGSTTTDIDTGEQYQTGEFDISKVTGIFISRDEETPTIYFNEPHP